MFSQRFPSQHTIKSVQRNRELWPSERKESNLQKLTLKKWKYMITRQNIKSSNRQSADDLRGKRGGQLSDVEKAMPDQNDMLTKRRETAKKKRGTVELETTTEQKRPARGCSTTLGQAVGRFCELEDAKFKMIKLQDPKGSRMEKSEERASGTSSGTTCALWEPQREPRARSGPALSWEPPRCPRHRTAVGVRQTSPAPPPAH